MGTVVMHPPATSGTSMYEAASKMWLILVAFFKRLGDPRAVHSHRLLPLSNLKRWLLLCFHTETHK